VTSFRVDDEFNAPVFKAGQPDKGVPLLTEDEGVMHRGADAPDAPSAVVPASAQPAQPSLPALPGAPATPAPGQ
jgi:type IV secretion system protein VirB8